MQLSKNDLYLPSQSVIVNNRKRPFPNISYTSNGHLTEKNIRKYQQLSNKCFFRQLNYKNTLRC